MAFILVATRETVTRSMLRQLTRPANYLLIEAETASECLAAVEQKPDLIVLDAQLGDEDGFSICLRLSFDHPAPILMLIPNEPAAIERAYASGATDVLIRPFGQIVLSHRAENLVRLTGKTVVGQEADWHRSIIENALEGAFRRPEKAVFCSPTGGWRRCWVTSGWATCWHWIFRRIFTSILKHGRISKPLLNPLM